MNRRGEAAERFAERRRQEDEAQRLRDAVPALVTCKIEIGESRREQTAIDVTHTRHVIVDRAPALFFIPCSDPSCRDGGHDITHMLVRGLKEGRAEVKGEDTCHGQIGTADCGRILRFTAFATYRA